MSKWGDNTSLESRGRLVFNNMQVAIYETPSKWKRTQKKLGAAITTHGPITTAEGLGKPNLQIIALPFVSN